MEEISKPDEKVEEEERDTSSISDYLLNQINTAPISHARRAITNDFLKAEQLAKKNTPILFGPRPLTEILERCHTTIALENIEGNLAAMVAFHDCPNIASVPSWDWYDWLYNLYALDGMNPRNCVFIHLAVWEIIHTSAFMQYILEYIFLMNPHLEYVIMLVPPKIYNLSWLEGHGTRIYPIGYSDSSSVQTIILILRQYYTKSYKIRRAVEEDNDDLVPLINTHSIRLQQEYGEFYIAEEITRHTDTTRQLIVAEYEGLAVAVLCLNEQVNYKELNDEFELIPFYGLYKPHQEDHKIRYSDVRTTRMNIPPSPVESTIKSWCGNYSPKMSLVGEQYSFITMDSNTTAIEQAAEIVEPATVVSSDESMDQISLVSMEPIKLFVPLDDNGDDDDDYHDDDERMETVEDLDQEDYSLDETLESSQSQEENNMPDDGRRPTAYIAYTPDYKGEPNAFTLEIAAAAPTHEISALFLLLQAAFECFSDRDYCILATPSMLPPFDMLQNFVRVSPRPISNYSQELYVLHRNSILSRMSVRKAESMDIAIVESLTYEMLKPAPMLHLFRYIVLEKTFEYQAFVILSEKQVIGLAIVRQVEDVLYLRTNYHLYEWVNQDHFYNDNHGLIKYMALSPIFQRHARYFLRELHRLSDFDALYYYIYPDDFNTALCTRCLCCVISNLFPVPPRLRPEYDVMEEMEEIDMDHPQQTFGLYVSTPRLTTISRCEINAKLVVVGASDISLSFFKQLIFSNNEKYRCTFFNLTLVSSEGLYMIKQEDPIRHMFFPKHNTFNSTQLQLLALRTYINVVHGVMTGIDRRKKRIIVDYTTTVNYDILILLCGMQFQRPTLTPEDTKEFPRNVYIINCEIDVEMALDHLKSRFRQLGSQDYSPVIVYGYCLEAYCCMAALLKLGIPGSRIVFVEPFPERSPIFEHQVSLFNDGEVDECVADGLSAAGITVYSSHYFCDWTMDSRENNVISVKFESKHFMKTIECSAMFMYSKKTVSMSTFLAINKAGLVFDGGVVIDPQFHTNDPYIYAAGTITKYSRRFYADDMVHKYYNLDEIGTHLAIKIKRMLIPQYNEDEGGLELTCTVGENTMPRYEKPIYTHCDLPGNLQYLYIRRPGKRVPLEVAMTADTYGDLFVTGDWKQLNRQGYFKLHLNQHGSVETITCLAKFDIEWLNLVKVWGMHESLLNNLQARFETMNITDLFEYFKQSWTNAIYHDQYYGFNDSVQELMLVNGGNNEIQEPIFNQLMDRYKGNGYQSWSESEWKQMVDEFNATAYPKEIKTMMLEYIVKHHSLLRHYAHPQIVRMILEGIEKSPLFHEQ